MRQVFRDRADAGRQLGTALLAHRDPSTIVLGLPRGGVPVARQVADALDAPLDVLVIRKLGSPRHPEYAMGAIGENSVRLVDPDALRILGLTEEALGVVEAAERIELDRRSERFRDGKPRLELAGRRVIIVDDGVATGNTAIVACRVARKLGASSLVFATPVAPPDWTERLAPEADKLIALSTPEPFFAVSRWYARFEQTSDDEVIAALDRS